MYKRQKQNPPASKRPLPVTKRKLIEQEDETRISAAIPQPDKKAVLPSYAYVKRPGRVLESIFVYSRTIRLEFIDNGVIDGDSISVFFNDKAVIEHEQLKAKPIVVNVYLQPGDNDIEMYAINLGNTSPNTALLTIYDGNAKYELAISSDLRQSGVIRLKYRQDQSK